PRQAATRLPRIETEIPPGDLSTGAFAQSPAFLGKVQPHRCAGRPRNRTANSVPSPFPTQALRRGPGKPRSGANAPNPYSASPGQGPVAKRILRRCPFQLKPGPCWSNLAIGG